MARPRRWWWLVGVAVLGAVVASWLLRPDTYVATPRQTTLPAARIDLAQDALATWLRERADTPAMAELRLSGVAGQVIAQTGAMRPDGTWAASATVRWSYGGVDPSAARVSVTVDLRTVGDAVEVKALSGPGRVPLWLSGSLSVSRTADTLVTTAPGIDHGAYARWATQAVTVVRRILPAARAPLVVEVPASAAALEATLGAAAGTYANVAAVTASVDGSDRADAPVHVFVNPDVLGRLKGSSAQIVLSHEATHALTGAVLNTRRPIWLTEGFADYVALRDVDVPLAESAGRIAALVRKSGPPAHLPGPADFDATSDRFGAEYEAAWLVNVQLADDGGERGLVRFYERVGAGVPIDAAMRAEIGYDERALTRRWQHRLVGLPHP